jgi:hypothetical protein
VHTVSRLRRSGRVLYKQQTMRLSVYIRQHQRILLAKCDALLNASRVLMFNCAEINPDDSGCAHSLQCSSIWPNAYCSQSGTCRCGNNQPGFLTRDGRICVNYGTITFKAVCICCSLRAQVNVQPTGLTLGIQRRHVVAAARPPTIYALHNCTTASARTPAA